MRCWFWFQHKLQRPEVNGVVADAEKTSWHDATFWSVREKRDKMAQQLPEWEDLREHASQIKKHTITPLSSMVLAVSERNLASIPKSGPEIKNRCTQEVVNGHNLAAIAKFDP